ncbi:MAG: hypothetical protein V4488_15215 [Pseudomonadota bacterium]
MSLTTATLVPTLLPTAYFSVVLLASPYPNSGTIFIVAIVAFLASLGHVAVLGIPGLLLLSRARQFKALPICLLGFFLGCLPMGIWSWPLKASLRGASDSHWDGEKIVHSMVDGVPTLIGWVSYGEGVLSMGAFGAVAGVAFWLAWRNSGSSNNRKER